jgi:pimeloyl-ACP methyl ester carboxylesterase
MMGVRGFGETSAKWSDFCARLREPGRMDPLEAMLGLSKADTAAVLDTSTVPALVVMGTKDSDFKDAVEEARMLAGKLDAETVIVEGAGHCPHTEMPNLVGPRIGTFLHGLTPQWPPPRAGRV